MKCAPGGGRIAAPGDGDRRLCRMNEVDVFVRGSRAYFPRAVDTDFPDHPHRDLMVAVEVEYLAGDLTVEQFEAEIDHYLAITNRRQTV